MGIEGNLEENKLLKVLKGKIKYVPQLDDTLAKKGYAADAKVTGDKIKEIANELKNFTKPDANSVEYDNSESGLEAETIQDAINEVADIAKNALPQNGGGIVNGTIGVKRFDNGHSSINKNHFADADYGTQLVDTDKNGNTAHLDVSALYSTISFTAADNEPHQLFHAGNKGFGNYSGNGNTTQRVVDTKGIGRLLLVYNTAHFSFVTPEGALVITLSDGSISWIDSGEVFYLNGKLTLITNNDAFNESGTTYHYQVI